MDEAVFNVPFLPSGHEPLQPSSSHCPFWRLCLFLSCRKTDCVHHETTASSHLLPLLNRRRHSSKSPVATQTPSLALLISLFSLFRSPRFSPSLPLLHSSIASDRNDVDLCPLWTKLDKTLLKTIPLCALPVRELLRQTSETTWQIPVRQHYTFMRQHYTVLGYTKLQCFGGWIDTNLTNWNGLWIFFGKRFPLMASALPFPRNCILPFLFNSHNQIISYGWEMMFSDLISSV